MSLIATIHYFVLPNLVQLAYTIHLLAVSIYLYEGYFFGVIACAIFKRSTYLDHLLRPVLLFALAVMIGLYVWSLLKPDSMACKDPLWLMFVSGQFVVTLFMVLIGRQIVKKLDRMQLFGNSLMEKKMQLWRLVLVNFACTSVSLLVEILDWFVVEDICDQWYVVCRNALCIFSLIHATFFFFFFCAGLSVVRSSMRSFPPASASLLCLFPSGPCFLSYSTGQASQHQTTSLRCGCSSSVTYSSRVVSFLFVGVCAGS
jgi:hypothetical protein